MNIAEYTQGFELAKQELCILAAAPKQNAFDIESRQVWGLLKHPQKTGRVLYAQGLWSKSKQAEPDAVEAAAVALLTRRGWSCVPPQAATEHIL